MTSHPHEICQQSVLGLIITSDCISNGNTCRKLLSSQPLAMSLSIGLAHVGQKRKIFIHKNEKLLFFAQLREFMSLMVKVSCCLV